MMLKGAGHKVTSAIGYHDAVRACAHDYDLFILGHSIPKNDKLDLIHCFRQKNPTAPVMALIRAGESQLKEVDAYLEPGDPEELIRFIDRTVKSTTAGNSMQQAN